MKANLIKTGTVEYTGPVGISLNDRLKKEINKRDFLFVIEQIIATIQKLNSNKLPVFNVVLDVNFIFINETTKELQFIYLPLENVNPATDAMGLIDYVVYASTPAQENDMDYISRFLYFLRGLERFEPERIERFILKEDRSVLNTIKRNNVGQSGYITDKRADYYDHYENNAVRNNQVDEEATDLLRESNEEATSLYQ